MTPGEWVSFQLALARQRMQADIAEVVRMQLQAEKEIAALRAAHSGKK